MFDRTTIIKSPDTIRVEEHRAPTDESIRFADEMQEKALARVTWSLVASGNVLEGAVTHVAPGFGDAVARIHVLFRLNGRDYKSVHPLQDASMAANPREALRLLAKEISEAISAELLERLLTGGLNAYRLSGGDGDPE